MCSNFGMSLDGFRICSKRGVAAIIPTIFYVTKAHGNTKETVGDMVWFREEYK